MLPAHSTFLAAFNGLSSKHCTRAQQVQLAQAAWPGVSSTCGTCAQPEIKQSDAGCRESTAVCIHTFNC